MNKIHRKEKEIVLIINICIDKEKNMSLNINKNEWIKETKNAQEKGRNEQQNLVTSKERPRKRKNKYLGFFLTGQLLWQH